MGRRTNKSGVSLVEVITAVAILGIAIPPIVAMFREVALRSPNDLYQNAAVHAANSLMEEIVSKSFEDPDLAPGSFGTEEPLRRQYDDIDDYDGYPAAADTTDSGNDLGTGTNDVDTDLTGSSALPQDADAQIFTNSDDSPFGGILLSVEVDNVDATDTDPVNPQPDGSTDYKRITVSASWGVGMGGEVRFKTLRTKVPTIATDVGPLDETGSAGSAQGGPKDLSLLLINTTDTPLEIVSFRVEADRDFSPIAFVQGLQPFGQFYYLWVGFSQLPTPDLPFNQWSSVERSIPANGTMETQFGFLSPSAPGDVTFTLTVNFTGGRSSVLTIPMEWN